MFKKNGDINWNMHYHFTKREKRALLTSWLVISLAFAIFLVRNQPLLFQKSPFLLRGVFFFLTATLTVGIGFLLHEGAHKVVAEYQGCHAEYKENGTMLIVSLLLSPWFIFAAPGGVHVSGRPSLEERGKTAFAGPAANILLTLLFILLFFLLPPGWRFIAGFGSLINALFGLFNLIPVPGFDGYTVLVWNKRVYGIAVAIAVTLSLYLQIGLGLF